MGNTSTIGKYNWLILEAKDILPQFHQQVISKIGWLWDLARSIVFVAKPAKSSSSQESHSTSRVRTSSPPIGHTAYHCFAAPLEVLWNSGEEEDFASLAPKETNPWFWLVRMVVLKPPKFLNLFYKVFQESTGNRTTSCLWKKRSDPLLKWESSFYGRSLSFIKRGGIWTDLEKRRATQVWQTPQEHEKT